MAFELNDSLEFENGITNFRTFKNVVNEVWIFYEKHLGNDLMNSIDLFIDNATCDCGYTPVTINVLNKFVIIKLNANSNSQEPEIAYVFAHELMHFIFFCKYGLLRDVDYDKEEAICTAASLIYIKEFYTKCFDSCNAHVKGLQSVYSKGSSIAENVSYNFDSLIKMI